MKPKVFNAAEISPTVVLAGDSVEFTIKLVSGPEFSSENTRIILDMPGYLGSTRPTCFGQEAHGYVAVFCSNPDITYTKRTAMIGEEPFPDTKGMHFFDLIAIRSFVLDFTGGKACEGDEIVIKWGYTRDNFGVGTKVTTLVLEKEFYNTIHVRYFKDGTKGLPDLARSFKGYERPIPDVGIPLSFKVLPREPESMRLIRSQSKSALLVTDRFGNITGGENAAEYVNGIEHANTNEYGVLEIPSPNIILTSKGLPLACSPEMNRVFGDMNIYFGDIHTHSSVSNDCIEREKQEIIPAGQFRYGRDVSRLDFMTITDHHQPWDIERNKIQRENWEMINQAAREFNKEGEFIAFPGFEFRCERGDTAVTLNEELDYSEIDVSSIKNIKDLWEHFKGKDYITIPHFHNQGRLEENEWYECPYEGIETVMEIYSCHGSYESLDVLERRPAELYKKRSKNGRLYLSKGYHYGLVCNSDGHKGNPGRNGLTAIYAKELTRSAVLDAIRKRQVYGTTNARIRLLFTMNGQLMGSVLKEQAKKEIHIAITGEQPLKAVDIFRRGELYQRYQTKAIQFTQTLTVMDEGPTNWYVRATQVDNHIAYSSPIWFE